MSNKYNDEKFNPAHIAIFCSYFLSQNAGIAAGTVSGITLNLKVLGIGDGLTVRHSLLLLSKLFSLISQDPLTQYPGYITYAGTNPYHPLVSSSVIQRAYNFWSSTNGCQTQVSPSFFLVSKFLTIHRIASTSDHLLL